MGKQELAQKLDNIEINAKCNKFREDAKLTAGMCRMFYDEFKNAGFNDEQSFELLLKMSMEAVFVEEKDYMDDEDGDIS